MNKRILHLAFCIVLSFGFTIKAQSNQEPEALGLPGDNLNLYAVLDLFQKSKTIEDFEKSLNDEQNKINNLDLNNDNNVDYIQVDTEKNGDSFLTILQVSVSQSEKQDVAVIEVDKNSSGTIDLQIIGDEELYGKNYVVEPNEDSVADGTPNPGYKNSETTIINNNTTNNYNSSGSNNDSRSRVSAWPIVIYFFSSLFVPWHSPWRWGFYPSYWRPWRPLFFSNYWGFNRHYIYGGFFRRTVIIRTPRYRTYYSNGRRTSIFVRDNRLRGNYKSTYNGINYKKPIVPVRNPNVNRPIVNKPSMVRPNASKPSLERPGYNKPNIPSSSVPSRPTTRPIPSKPTVKPNVRPNVNPNVRPSVNPSVKPNYRPVNKSKMMPARTNRKAVK